MPHGLSKKHNHYETKMVAITNRRRFILLAAHKSAGGQKALQALRSSAERDYWVVKGV